MVRCSMSGGATLLYACNLLDIRNAPVWGVMFGQGPVAIVQHGVAQALHAVNGHIWLASVTPCCSAACMVAGHMASKPLIRRRKI